MCGLTLPDGKISGCFLACSDVVFLPIFAPFIENPANSTKPLLL
jgi:hypothetical protein